MFIPKDVEVNGGFSHKLFESPFSVARWLAQSLLFIVFFRNYFSQNYMPQDGSELYNFFFVIHFQSIAPGAPDRSEDLQNCRSEFYTQVHAHVFSCMYIYIYIYSSLVKEHSD